MMIHVHVVKFVKENEENGNTVWENEVKKRWSIEEVLFGEKSDDESLEGNRGMIFVKKSVRNVKNLKIGMMMKNCYMRSEKMWKTNKANEMVETDKNVRKESRKGIVLMNVVKKAVSSKKSLFFYAVQR